MNDAPVTLEEMIETLKPLIRHSRGMAKHVSAWRARKRQNGWQRRADVMRAILANLEAQQDDGK